MNERLSTDELNKHIVAFKARLEYQQKNPLAQVVIVQPVMEAVLGALEELRIARAELRDWHLQARLHGWGVEHESEDVDE